jgi:hypothetical protein
MLPKMPMSISILALVMMFAAGLSNTMMASHIGPKDVVPGPCVWESETPSLGAARKLENLLKRQKGGRGFYRLTGLTDR